jgi:hypothetical protein
MRQHDARIAELKDEDLAALVPPTSPPRLGRNVMASVGGQVGHATVATHQKPRSRRLATASKLVCLI